jgi:hypothetical protein
MEDATKDLTLVDVPCVYSLVAIRLIADKAVTAANADFQRSGQPFRISVQNTLNAGVKDSNTEFRVMVSGGPGESAFLSATKEITNDSEKGTIYRTLHCGPHYKEQILPSLTLRVNDQGKPTAYLEDELLDEDSIGRELIEPILAKLSKIDE